MDTYGFSVLPTGYRVGSRPGFKKSREQFYGGWAQYWSSSLTYGEKVHTMKIGLDVGSEGIPEYYWLGVRCIKDND